MVIKPKNKIKFMCTCDEKKPCSHELKSTAKMDVMFKLGYNHAIDDFEKERKKILDDEKERKKVLDEIEKMIDECDTPDNNKLKVYLKGNLNKLKKN